MRNAFRTIDPSRALSHIQTMGNLVTQTTAQRRFQSILVSVFAGAAMLLAVVGIYGLLSYSVRQRTSQIGLRMALGAPRMQVVALFLREGLGLAAIGLPLGSRVHWQSRAFWSPHSTTSPLSIQSHSQRYPHCC